MGTPNVRYLLVFLLGAVLAGGLKHLIDGTAEESAAGIGALSPGLEVRSLPASEPSPNAGHLQPSKRELARAVPAAMKVSDDQVQSLVAALGTLEGARDPGNGTLHGRVVDQDGVGLGGVVLRLTASVRRRAALGLSSVGGDAPELGTLEEAVRKAADSFNEKKASLQQVESDEQGRFRFDALADEKWHLVGYKSGYKITADAAATSLRIGTELDFTGTALLELDVRVVDPGGKVVGKAILSVTKKEKRARKMRYSWTAEEPRLRLEPGSYEITAFSDSGASREDAELASEMQELTVAVDSEPTGLKLELRSRLGMRGVLNVAVGDPRWDYYYVRTQLLAPQQELDLGLLLKSPTMARVRPGAQFSFLDLEPGRYVVGVSRSWGSSILHHVEVELSDQMVNCDLDMPPLDRSRYLHVTVSNATGESIPSVEFKIAKSKDSTRGQRKAESVRERDGTYLVRLSDELEDVYWGTQEFSGEFELVATHADYGERKVKLMRGQGDVTLSFFEPGTLTATIVGYQGSGFEGRLSVKAVRESDNATGYYFSSNRQKGVGPDGVQVIESLEPGVYIVTLKAAPKKSKDAFLRSNTLETLTVEIVAGDNQVQLSIPFLYSLKVHWEDGKAGTDVYLNRMDSTDPFRGMVVGKLGTDGYAKWDDLRAGDYVILGGEGRMKVTVPCGEVEFEVMEVKALRVTITDPNCDLAKLGFKSGDLIIGVDGAEFEEAPDFGLFAKLSSNKTAEATFLVLRDEARLDIHVKGSALGSWQDMGGMVMPALR